jgi:hypothetical protein
MRNDADPPERQRPGDANRRAIKQLSGKTGELRLEYRPTFITIASYSGADGVEESAR